MDEKKKMETSKAALEKELADLKETLSASEQVPFRVRLIPFRHSFSSSHRIKSHAVRRSQRSHFDIFIQFRSQISTDKAATPATPPRPDPWGLGWDMGPGQGWVTPPTNPPQFHILLCAHSWLSSLNCLSAPKHFFIRPF